MSAPIIIVSGLPRSGTSLMMQMLEAGGIQALTDGVRSADSDNPRGYFEWEAVKKIGQDHRVIERAASEGKTVKVISTLLPKLPKAYQYKILFMERDFGEIIQSQQRMLATLGEPPDTENLIETAKRLKAHNDQIIAWIKTTPHIDTLMVSHRKIIQKPAGQISKIISFLGQDNLPSSDSMMGAVAPDLYRNRSRQGFVTYLSSLLFHQS